MTRFWGATWSSAPEESSLRAAKEWTRVLVILEGPSTLSLLPKVRWSESHLARYRMPRHHAAFFRHMCEVCSVTPI